MAEVIDEATSRKRQAALLARPGATEVLSVVAGFVRAAVPDIEDRLGTSVGFTVMGSALLSPEERQRPGAPKNALMSVNVAQSVLITVQDLPVPSFRFLVLECPEVDHAMQTLAAQGVHSVLSETSLKRLPKRWELAVDGIADARVALANEPLRAALRLFASQDLDRKLFNPSWHDPHAARLLLEALPKNGPRVRASDHTPPVGTWKADAYKSYRVHGEGLTTLRDGFVELGMPERRREEALAIIGEVLAANEAADFRWYKTDGTVELACYWQGKHQNVLWVTPSEVHIPADTSLVRRPSRPTDWEKERGKYVGWLLPGANRGTGGGRRDTPVATVLCPETFVRQPANTVCPDCDVVHTDSGGR